MTYHLIVDTTDMQQKPAKLSRYVQVEDPAREAWRCFIDLLQACKLAAEGQKNASIVQVAPLRLERLRDLGITARIERRD